MKSAIIALLAFCLCLPLVGDEDAKKLFQEIKVKAEAGDKDAQHNLGVMYERGEGVQQNRKEAVKWYRKAAEQGLAEAQYNLGVTHQKGKSAGRR